MTGVSEVIVHVVAPDGSGEELQAARVELVTGVCHVCQGPLALVGEWLLCPRCLPGLHRQAVREVQGGAPT